MKVYLFLLLFCSGIINLISAQCVSYDVKVCIDGSDTLKIQGDSMWWCHRHFTPPGLHASCISNAGVTIEVNGNPWSPWDSAYMIQNIANDTLTLDSIICSKACNLLQAPSAANNWQTQYFFNDDNLGGPHLYEVIFIFCSSATIPPPVISFEASDTAVCSNDCISFTDHSVNVTSWQWIFSGGYPPISTDQNPPSVCYLAAGSYDVSLIASNAGGRDSVTLAKYILVDSAPPSPDILQTQDTIYCHPDPSYISYQWYMDSIPMQGETDTLIVFSEGGNYNLEVTNQNGCKTASGINVILGVQNSNAENGISLSPNPAIEELIVHTLPVHSGKEVELYIMNMLGEVVHKEMRKLNGDADINIEKLPAGIYFLQIKSMNINFEKRFIKE